MATYTGTATTTINGLAAFMRRIERVQRLGLIVAYFAELIANEAEALAPVDTGALKASIKVTLEGYAARISAGEGLPDGRAVFQELGFHHWLSGAFIQNPYLRPAVERHIAAFIAAVRAAVA